MYLFIYIYIRVYIFLSGKQGYGLTLQQGGAALACLGVAEEVDALHCNTLQHTAMHCNTLKRTATHCYILLHSAHTVLKSQALHEFHI